ncbi:MAG: carbohydrate ABC transporter substrate-binding protein, partial [Oscillospiraceae bacterium]|nr:carbohydrate ABC transporter substrate-binding protein [Oscillospiraceae bacterium]
MKKCKALRSLLMAAAVSSTMLFQGCKADSSDGKIQVTMLQYKPEAVKAFEEIERRFNETHDNITLKIESPNEAMTVLKTRLIREDYPAIVGIGGDIKYSKFLDADLVEDISALEIINNV